MVVDHYQDRGKLLGIQIDWEPEELEKEAYAWEEARLFPVHTPEDTLLSALYFEKQAEYIPEEVGIKIAKALKAHGIEEVFTKVAKDLTEEEKKELPDSVFGLVVKDPKTGEKIRKYPMPDAEHVRKAIQFFNQHYKEYPEEWRVQIAKKIVEKAKEFGVEVQDEEVLKYAGKAKSDMKKAAELIREFRVTPLWENEQARAAYEKVAEVFEKTAGLEVPPEELEQAVEQLYELDKVFGVNYSRLPSPRLLVFNEKLAEEMVKVAETEVPLAVLESIPDEAYQELVGFIPDRTNLKAEIEALPRPEQEILYQFIVNEGLLEN